MTRAQGRLHSKPAAFAFGVPVATLGGLIGLGGAEFRLPILLGPLGYAARKAVVINLLISLVTIAAALVVRSRTVKLDPLDGYWLAILALMGGAVVAAYLGTGLVRRLPETVLERVLAALLAAIGVLLLLEGFQVIDVSGLLPENTALEVSAGFGFGLCIGLVSSLLGVAGGEIIIPVLVFVYGMDLVAAGTASLLISLPTVVTGVARHARAGLYDRESLTQTAAPMAAGSVVGAIIGGVLAGTIPVNLLKVILGVVLLVSASRMLWADYKRRAA